MYLCIEGQSTDEKSGFSSAHGTPARSTEIGQKKVKALLKVRRTAARKGMPVSWDES